MSSSSQRFPDLTQLRKAVTALYRHGYPIAARSILRGITRVINVRDAQDWDLFRNQMAHHERQAWFGDDIDSFLDDSELVCYTLSYRHVDWRGRTPQGATMNSAQWQRLHSELIDSSRRNKTNRFVLWIDQILHCSESLSAGTNWITKGLLPYIVLPVIYIGGPDEEEDEACQRRLWPSIERAAALTSGGIVLHGRSNHRTTMFGASLGLAPSLKWLASRIICGTFNQCELSWTEDYLSFRQLSLQLMRSNDPLGTIEAFLKVDSSPGDVKFDMISVMEAFRYSHDDQNLHSSGPRQPFFGTYLSSKVEKSMTDSGEWHGLREWVQYEWDDGVLLEEKPEELKQILEITRWALFVDAKDRRFVYAVGVVSRKGELQAMGVARLRDVKRKGEGCILWFQRGVSGQARSYSRHIANRIKPDGKIMEDISEHWHIEIGEPIALVDGANISWKWHSHET